MKKKVTKRVVSKGKVKRGGNKFIKFGIILVLFIGGFMYLKHKSRGMSTKTYLPSSFSLQRTETNYGDKVDSLSKVFNLPAHYLKALITLECSGRTEFEPRFEPHIYRQLKQVRDRHKKSFGSITHKTLKNASDNALKNLATSWGPFQLMGYQCIELDVVLQDIRGENAVYWGIFWINKRYGKKLRREHFEDAFHIHNTGQPLPKNKQPRTHDPKYIEKGLQYMAFFKTTPADEQ